METNIISSMGCEGLKPDIIALKSASTLPIRNGNLNCSSIVVVSSQDGLSKYLTYKEWKQ